MNAFLTGSQVYGKPTDDSDYDLVIRCSNDVVTKLLPISDSPPSEAELSDNSHRRLSLKFGKLNILCCINDRQYAEWVLGTSVLKEGSPVDRPKAVKMFQRLRGMSFEQLKA